MIALVAERVRFEVDHEPDTRAMKIGTEELPIEPLEFVIERLPATVSDSDATLGTEEKVIFPFPVLVSDALSMRVALERLVLELVSLIIFSMVCSREKVPLGAKEMVGLAVVSAESAPEVRVLI